MARDVTLRPSVTRGCAVRQIALGLAICFAASVVSATDLGRAAGALTIDKDRVEMAYAYALGHQRNEITKRRDEVKVILTDKPLGAGANLDQIEATIPDNMYAMIFNVASNGKVTHVSVLHPKGSYDGGFLEEIPEFKFKGSLPPRGTLSGKITSSKVQTNTMAFTIDADFNAEVK